MKTLFLATLAFLTASSAFADSENLFLQLRVTHGFAPPEHTFSIECDVSSENTLVRSRKGLSPEWKVRYEPTKYTDKVPNFSAAMAIVKNAARSDLKVFPAPMDVPYERLIGIIEGAVVDQHVKLSGSSDGMGNQYRNKAAGVADLYDLARVNCPMPE